MEFGVRFSNYKGRQMIKTTPHKIAILMGVLLSPSVFATDSQSVVIIAIIRDIITSKCDVTGCRFDSGCKLNINIRCKCRFWRFFVLT